MTHPALAADPNEPPVKVEFRYDYLGRRIKKRVLPWNPALNGGAGGWDAGRPTKVTRFVWSGWLMLMELDGLRACGTPGSPAECIVRKYTWGLDLAGQNRQVNSLESAGAVGGLLAAYDASRDRPLWYFYDANGNVGQVVTVISVGGPNYRILPAAQYEYDPYGNRINPLAQGEYEQPFQFSTHQFDLESGLIYAKERYYRPDEGRWVSRDPAGEIDVVGLYITCRNDLVAWVDPDGQRATRSDRRDRRTDRRDRWPDRRSRRRLFGGDFASDWAGREILWHYLYGKGVPVEHIHDPRWSEYMMSSPLLTELTQAELRNIALPICKTAEDGATVPIDHVCRGEMENGEGIIGYNYLHGSNAHVGGYKIQGTATKTTVSQDGQCCCVVSFNLDFEWNDKIDPNPQYDTDSWKAWFADIVWEDASKYDIKIRWHSESVFKNCCGREENSGGWPFEE